MKKIGVLTSGGDSPGMNAAIRAITRTAIDLDMEVYGIHDGYKGLINGDFERFERSSVSETLGRGGTILGSARLPEFKDASVREIGIRNLKNEGIEGIIVIGGDGSYRGANELTKAGVLCVGVPGTIDNDIAGTDYTIGFDTALYTVVEAIDKLRDTSSSHNRCSVVEVMGNHCGDLAIYAGIATGAEIVITPEIGYNEDEVIEKLRYFHDVRRKRHAIVILSEKLINANELADVISLKSGFSARATVLGHVQRGGCPSPSDRVLASRMGEKAVNLLYNNIGGHCVGIVENKIISMEIDKALSMPKASRKHLYELFEHLV